MQLSRRMCENHRVGPRNIDMCNFPPKKVEKNELLENNCTREGVGIYTLGIYHNISPF